jgi:hypothetical protein
MPEDAILRWRKEQGGQGQVGGKVANRESRIQFKRLLIGRARVLFLTLPWYVSSQRYRM